MAVEDATSADQGQDQASLGQVAADGVQGVGTVADVLRAGYQAAVAQHREKDVVLPGYGEPASELHVTFRVLSDYEETRPTIAKAAKQNSGSAAQRDIAIAIETLRLAASSSYAVVGGQRHEIGQPLGLGLYDYLALDDTANVRATTDAQAIVRLFHDNTVVLTSVAAEYDIWCRRAGQQAEEELLGE